MNWFGNDDEPDPPAAFWPGYPQFVRVIAWHWRNPLHNFAAYVIGVKGKQFIFVASQPNTVDSSFADGGDGCSRRSSAANECCRTSHMRGIFASMPDGDRAECSDCV